MSGDSANENELDIEKLLGAERGREGFSRAARDAMWAGVEKSIATGAAVGVAAGAGAGAGASAGAGAGAKLATLIATTLLVGAGVGALVHAHFADPKVVMVEHRVNVPMPAVAPAVVAPVVTAAAAPSASASGAAPRASASAFASASAAPAVSAAKDPALARERTLLDMSRTALTRGDTTSALAALETHAKEFPKSQLAQEREVLAIQALSSAGRLGEARTRAAAFRAAYPKSPLTSIVDDATK